MNRYFVIIGIFLICTFRNSAAQELRISSYSKIGASLPELSSYLSAGDRFGSAFSTVGDIDNNGINDLAIGASQDDDGGTDRGGVYIIFLDNNSSIINTQKISSTEGGFTGVLINNDRFGSAVAPIGDLNNDGVDDIAVGSLYDGDGAHQSGAVWILFLNNNGTVKSHQKISNTQGNFTGTLASLASFGCSIAALGDLNKDGANDIIVGAYRDNSALQSKSGAAWIIFLNNNGTVKSAKKIGAGNNGFSKDLDFEDYFGGEITVVDDYDQNGIPDIAISAHRDDDGGTSKGAVYILSVDESGLVTKSTKISDNTANFNSLLKTNDCLGTAICSIGDVNNDGVHDLLIASQTNAGGGERKGAFYILLMNQTGSVDSITKYEDGPCNDIDLKDHDMLGSNAALIANDNNTIRVLISALNGDDVIMDTGVIYEITLSSGADINAGEDINTCSAKSIFLNGQAPVSKIGEWEFYKGYGNILEPNNPKSEVTDLYAGVNKLIWRIKGGDCPLDTDTVTIKIDNKNISADAGDDIKLCDQSEVQLSAELPDGFSGAWSIIEGNGIFIDDKDPSTKVTNLLPGKTILTWSGKYNNCETVSDTVNLFVERKRTDAVSAGNDLQIDCLNKEVNLTGTLSKPGGAAHWEIINGEATIDEPDKMSTKIHDFSGSVEVVLALKGNVCPIVASDTLNIAFEPPKDIFIPNIFTPNRDDHNQTFIVDERLINPSLAIYNRWGEQLFADPSYNNNWQAHRISAGVYYYEIKSACQPDTYRGWVTIIK